ncbi:CoA transferase [Vibrio sp. S4M6]|uniref:CoA transferase n=1 Tax=Vibrio sinus TaxID=2946865 RepID=UPI00202A0D31|nr:CoA transferase [Vibrio sinus]MCL9782044.1 CoA transferase [Vibrio sinus]
MSVTTRSYQNGDLPELSQLIDILGMSNQFNGDFVLEGQDPIIYSPHKLGYASAVGQGANALLTSMIWQYRSGEINTATMKIHDALNSLHENHYVLQNGYPMTVGAESVPVNSYFKCKDGRSIHIIAGPPYVKLQNGYLNFFDCGNDRNRIGEEIAKWNSFELEEALSEIGLPACVARTKEEWLEHPVGKSLSQTPVIDIEKVADSAPVPYSTNAKQVLEGIKVLDFTHVLAGPMCGQNLGRLGADVLHISSPNPNQKDTLPQNLITNFCKRNAYLDLNLADDKEKLQQLVSEADVIINSYRPNVPKHFGIDIDEVIKHNANGVVYLDISCYGKNNIWSDRAGFETIGQACSGFSVSEAHDSVSEPLFSPVFYLNDPMTSYFALSGVLAAIQKRAIDGGSYHVNVSLARSGMWVEDLGLLEEEAYNSQPKSDVAAPHLMTTKTVYGDITRLAHSYEFDNLEFAKEAPVHPFGADKPEFLK